MECAEVQKSYQEQVRRGNWGDIEQYGQDDDRENGSHNCELGGRSNDRERSDQVDNDNGEHESNFNCRKRGSHDDDREIDGHDDYWDNGENSENGESGENG